MGIRFGCKDGSRPRPRARRVAIVIVIFIVIIAALVGAQHIYTMLFCAAEQAPQADQIVERTVILSIGGDSASGIERVTRQLPAIAAQTTSAVMTGHADTRTLCIFVCVIVIAVLLFALVASLVRSVIKSTKRKER